MQRLGLAFLIAALVTCGLHGAARAEKESPSVFTHAYHGLWVGSMAGLAGGYLVARQDGWESSRDWKPLVYGAGAGALAGSLLGLTVGIVDVTQDKPGRTRYVMRDMAYGVGFGATAGGIAGGLAALSTGKAEHILLGGSIGVLSGAVLGCVFGFIEGGHARTAALGQGSGYALSVVPVAEAEGGLAWLPALSGRY
jgi:hypothetical protein